MHGTTARVKAVSGTNLHCCNAIVGNEDLVDGLGSLMLTDECFHARERIGDGRSQLKRDRMTDSANWKFSARQSEKGSRRKRAKKK